MKSYLTIFLISGVAFIAFTVDNVNAEKDCDCIFNHSKTMFESIERVSAPKPNNNGLFLKSYQQTYEDAEFRENFENFKEVTMSTFATYMDNFLTKPVKQSGGGDTNNAGNPAPEVKIRPAGEQSGAGDANKTKNVASEVIGILLNFCTNIKNDKQNCTERVREPIFLLKELDELYRTLTGGNEMDKFEQKCGRYIPQDDDI